MLNSHKVVDDRSYSNGYFGENIMSYEKPLSVIWIFIVILATLAGLFLGAVLSTMVY